MWKILGYTLGVIAWIAGIVSFYLAMNDSGLPASTQIYIYIGWIGIGLIVFSFLTFLAVDSLDNFLGYYSMPLPIFSQLSLFINLVLFLSILVHYLWYLNSEFGRFYEDFRFSNRPLNIKLLRRKTLVEKYVVWLQVYFSYIPNRIFFIILMVISISFFLYFYPYGYEKLHFMILIGLIMILFVYINFLIKKRTKKLF